MNTCRRHLQACAIRVARLDSSGVPEPGANNLYVSDALSTLTVDTEIEEGDEFIEKNACGDLCINFKDCDRLKRLTLTLGLCYPDPELLELLAGGTVLTEGEAVGYAYPRLGQQACPNGISLELWVKRVLVDGSLDADFPYEWYTLPRVFFQLGGRTFENGPVTVELSGFGIENENWFDGPTNDWPVDSSSALQSIPTASLPEAACGYQELLSSV